jgi:hypothetical protein
VTATYSTRLGIEPPNVEQFIDGGTKLLHLVVLALVESSRPLTLDELVRRLGTAGVGSRVGDLGHSIQKAWHGLPPVVRGADGRFDLDLEADELRWLLRDLGLLKAPPAARIEPPPPPERADHEPLTEQEVKAVLGRPALSSLRQTAAILDMTGRPMSVDEIDAYAKAASSHAWKIAGQEPRSGWRTDLFHDDGAGRLAINRDSPAVVPMRQAVRKLAQPRLVERARQAFWAERREIRDAELAVQAREDVAKAASLRRAVLRVFVGAGGRATALVDLGTRTMRSFMPDEIGQLPAALDAFDVLIGLDLREHLVALDLEVGRWRLIDLGPPQKTLRLNKAGRTLKITTEMLIRSSVGISRALGDPKKTAQYMADDDRGKLARRIGSDAKHLAMYYAYGASHGFVRLRWGFLNERLGVSWALPGDLLLYDLLKRALVDKTPLDVVLGWSAPGWEQPWSRARRVTVTKFECGRARLDDGRESEDVPLEEIQAARVAP